MADTYEGLIEIANAIKQQNRMLENINSRLEKLNARLDNAMECLEMHNECIADIAAILEDMYERAEEDRETMYTAIEEYLQGTDGFDEDFDDLDDIDEDVDGEGYEDDSDEIPFN